MILGAKRKPTRLMQLSTSESLKTSLRSREVSEEGMSEQRPGGAEGPSVGRARSEPSGGGNSTYKGPEAAMSLVFEQGVSEEVAGDEV